MVSSKQKRQYQVVREGILAVRGNCKHAQCSGFNKHETRCRLCVGAKRLTGALSRCHVHHDKPDVLNRLSRNRSLVLGYDAALEENSSKWLADDAIHTALKVMADKARVRRVRTGLITPTNNIIVYDPPASGGAIRAECYICLVRSHWITVWIESGTVFVFDSLAGSTAYRFLPNSLPNDDDMDVKPVADLPQQTNENDCGCFAIFFAYCLIYNHKIPRTIPEFDSDEPDKRNASSLIRHATVLMLLAKHADYLKVLI